MYDRPEIRHSAHPSKTRTRYKSGVWLIGLLVLAGAASAQAPLPRLDDRDHLGVATCAGSTCHGSAEPLEAADVLQNEYLTWHRRDAHARAWAVLRSDRSQRIADRLGLGPAQEADACLDCHADNVAPERRGARFQISDGIGCEACHGGSEDWLKAHVSGEATHADNIARGLYPTEQTAARTRLCMSCHYSHPASPMSHRIMAAGHPPLLFEVDTFSRIQPVHYRIDTDYRARKTVTSAARGWAIGQTVGTTIVLEHLRDDLARSGLFPELYYFDCNACHHRMQDADWVTLSSTGRPLGSVPLEDASLQMLGHVAAELDSELGRAWRRGVARLHGAVDGGADAVRGAVAPLQRLAADIRGRLEADGLGRQQVFGLMARIAAAGETAGFADRNWSDQAAMALAALLTTAAETGTVSGDRLARLERSLDDIYAALENPRDYSPWRYREAVREFGRALP